MGAWVVVGWQCVLCWCRLWVGVQCPGGVRMEGPVGSSVQARVGLAMAWTPVSLYDAAGGVSSYSYLWAEYTLGAFAANGHEDSGEEVGQE